MSQIITQMSEAADQLYKYISDKEINKLFLVCGRSYESLSISSYMNRIFKKNDIKIVFFRDFKPNPEYESVANGIRIFKDNCCDAIMAVGGGSAIDVAKCIKAYINADDSKCFLEQPVISNNIPFIAIPTTAGTGSEATKFAVVYYKGEKQSVEDKSCIPDFVVLDPDTLIGLSDYQKKATLLDVLCHAVESFWSVNSTDKSRSYSKKALGLILSNYKEYVETGSSESRKNMMLASNIAGKAINITKTTAGHAMCYKLTSLYDIPHGYAAAMCNAELFPYMVNNTQKCIDKRGAEYLNKMFRDLALSMNADTLEKAVEKFAKIVRELIPEAPVATKKDIDMLTTSVNVSRLKNNPIKLEPDVIGQLYKNILKTDK